MKSNQWLLVLMLGCAVAGSAGPAAAQERISEEARNYFRNGVDLLQSNPPNYQDAYYQFKLAYEKSKSWKVLGNLGLCAVKLERDGEALKYYDDYLKGGGKQIDKEEREAIERDMLLIRGNTAAVELSSPAGEIEVRDLRAGSSAVAQSYQLEGGKQTLLLRAGSHTLTAINKEGRELRWDIVLTPGRSVSHVFDFDAPVASPATTTESPPGVVGPPPAPPEPIKPPSSGSWFSPLRITGMVATGVGLGVIVGGVVTGIKAKDREADGDAKCNKVLPDGSLECETSAAQDFDDASKLAKTANILYVTGGVLAGAGIGLMIFGGGTSPEVAKARPLKLTPVIGMGGGALFASGTF
ncbi:MAG TPA: hypothetical protein VFQ61_15665 [Polyangiaceae bacterium]|nr:hypothetical protein [Polyangiaceae bacterium]